MAPPASPNVEHLGVTMDVTLNWDYGEGRADLRSLYRKAKTAQWNGEDLDWSTDVDLEREAFPETFHPLFGSDLYGRLTEQEKKKMGPELTAWTQSQFLHGEQGALLAAAQLVDTVPDVGSKLYASTQVVDEGRHVEVFHRYLSEKVGFSYPISPHLKTLLDLILKDARWDMKLLGMQVMVEGLALAAFGVTRDTVLEPLLRSVTDHVIRDEARHVAYGVLSLSDVYRDMSAAEVAEREDFVYEAARLMRDRFLFQEVWEKLGLPVEECKRITFDNEAQKLFRQHLFSKIVPAVRRIGLLSPRQRVRFEELGILQYEHFDDPSVALRASVSSAVLAPGRSHRAAGAIPGGHAMSMRLGVTLPQCGPVAGPEAVRAIAESAESLGFDSLWVLDRLLYPVAPKAPYPATPDGSLPDAYRRVLDPILTLTYAAAVTKRVTLGTSVLNLPWYNPNLLARQLTSLDVLSNGRVRAGLGTGWSPDEYEAVGVDMKTRGARAYEALDVLKKSWTEATPSHAGTFYSLPKTHLDLRPVQSPRPKIYMAAYTPATMKRVAEQTDGWNPAGVPVAAMKQMWDGIRGMAQAAGRDPKSLELIVRANLVITTSPLGDDRGVYTGSLDQVRADVAATREIGAHELFFELGFTDEGRSLDGQLALLKQLRGM